MNYKSVLALFFLSFIASACASITSDTSQPVTITAICDGKGVKDATCTLSNSKGSFIVSTPGTVTIRKAWGDVNILCEKGESVGSATFKSSSNANTWGNVLLGGGIGAVVDAGTGAGYNYPTVMNVKMNPPCEEKSSALFGSRGVR